MNKETMDVLNTAKHYMNNLNTAILKAAEYFQNGDYSNGAELVSQITDGLEWVIDLVTLRKDIYIKDMNPRRITDNIKEIVEAFKNEDYVLIGDLLQYEISPVIEEYYEKTCAKLKLIKYSK